MTILMATIPLFPNGLAANLLRVIHPKERSISESIHHNTSTLNLPNRYRANMQSTIYEFSIRKAIYTVPQLGLLMGCDPIGQGNKFRNTQTLRTQSKIFMLCPTEIPKNSA